MLVHPLPDPAPACRLAAARALIGDAARHLPSPTVRLLAWTILKPARGESVRQHRLRRMMVGQEGA